MTTVTQPCPKCGQNIPFTEYFYNHVAHCKDKIMNNEDCKQSEEMAEMMLKQEKARLIRSDCYHDLATEYLQKYEIAMSRIEKAKTALLEMIDGGEELRGHDSQISEVIRILQD